MKKENIVYLGISEFDLTKAEDLRRLIAFLFDGVYHEGDSASPDEEETIVISNIRALVNNKN